MARLTSAMFSAAFPLSLFALALCTTAAAKAQNTSTPSDTPSQSQTAGPGTASQTHAQKGPCLGDFGAYMAFFDTYGALYDQNQLDLAKGIQPKYPTETWAEKSSHGAAGLKEEEWEAVFEIVIDTHKQIVQEQQTDDEYHAKYLQDQDAEALQGMKDSDKRERSLYEAGIQRIHGELGDQQFARLSHDIDLSYHADACAVIVSSTSHPAAQP